MKVGELIEKLKEFDPEMEVGGSGHLGEILEIYDVRFCKICESATPYVNISIECAGEGPD